MNPQRIQQRRCGETRDREFLVHPLHEGLQLADELTVPDDVAESPGFLHPIGFAFEPAGTPVIRAEQLPDLPADVLLEFAVGLGLVGCLLQFCVLLLGQEFVVVRRSAIVERITGIEHHSCFVHGPHCYAGAFLFGEFMK